jgi:O-6-methylguanine DNA methyltransferase
MKQSFTERVYRVVARIPKGKTLSYKEVAEKAGSPRAYRAVGNILNKNRSPNVPCHRVIKSDGSVGGYYHGTRAKRTRLIQEKALMSDI